MTLRLNGSTSGYVEIDAPAAAGSTAITIPATTGGEFIVSDSAGDVNIDNGTLFVDASTDRVGIGTTSGTAKLEVVDSSFHQLYARGSSTVAGIRFGNTSYTNGYIYYDEGPNLIFHADGGEKMRLKSNGDVVFTVRGGNTLELGGSTNHCIYRAASNMSGIHFSDHSILPANGSGAVDDNVHDLGNSGYRWDDVFATNGTIQTSDQNLKQDVAQLTDAELAAAKAIRGLVKTYRWIDSVEEKGDEARIHVGVIAQEVEQAFIDQGLDPTRYALFCKDSWYAVDGKAMDNNGETYTEDTPGAVLVERRGVRYPQLLAFVMAAVDAEATAFETRLTALEGGTN